LPALTRTAKTAPSSTAPPTSADPLSAHELRDPLTAPSTPTASKATSSHRGIEDVESMGNDEVLRQDARFGSLEGMMAQAQAGQDELAGGIQAAADEAGATAVIPPIKSLERAAAKVQSDMGGDWRQIADVCRGTIVSQSVSSVGKAFDALKGKVNVKRIKNRFKDPKANGYRDMNLVVEIPKAKMLGEVQLHVAQIQEIKSGEEHHVYERIQAIERGAKDAKRPLNADEVSEISRLQAESKKLYDGAWAAAKANDEPSSASPATA
jgi:hypothetical protein